MSLLRKPCLFLSHPSPRVHTLPGPHGPQPPPRATWPQPLPRQTSPDASTLRAKKHSSLRHSMSFEPLHAYERRLRRCRRNEIRHSTCLRSFPPRVIRLLNQRRILGFMSQKRNFDQAKSRSRPPFSFTHSKPIASLSSRFFIKFGQLIDASYFFDFGQTWPTSGRFRPLWAT